MASKYGTIVRYALVLAMSLIVAIVVARGDTWVRRSDNAIRVDVQRVLRTDRSLYDSYITVKSVRSGVVVLSGIAASANDGLRAHRLVADRPGVRRVLSRIVTDNENPAQSEAGQVGAPVAAMSSRPRNPVGAEDDVIRRGVTNALNDLDARENADVHVMVKDRVVWLSGTVPAWDGNSSRMYAARSVVGVRSIMNGVRVVGPHGATP